MNINQTDFVKGQHLGDSGRTLHDIIDYCKLKKMCALIHRGDFSVKLCFSKHNDSFEHIMTKLT